MRWLGVAFFLCGAAPAIAQPKTETRTIRYGGAIAIADGISLAFLGGGLALISNYQGGPRVVGILSTIAGAGGYLWASPIVHYTRGRDEVYKLDIGMRVIVPAIGIAAGSQLAKCADDTFCDDVRNGMLIGGALGVAITSGIDIALMAKVTYAAPVPGGAVIGLAGYF